MFINPVKRPPCANILPLISIYLIKSDGIKNVQCVCNS